MLMMEQRGSRAFTWDSLTPEAKTALRRTKGVCNKQWVLAVDRDRHCNTLEQLCLTFCSRRVELHSWPVTLWLRARVLDCSRLEPQVQPQAV